MNNIIAKLLARENITIIEGNFRTASFDVLNRTLRVPAWSFDNKDLYDLFIGHEVGHALYTTIEDIHGSREIIPGVPFSYVNVVEDCRIEKLIRRDFPGLVPAFKRAYNELLAREFFGADIESRINGLSLIDRINIKAKCGHAISVEFSPEEQTLFNMCMSTETWEDVIKAIQAIIEHEKTNKPENKPTPQPNHETHDEESSMDDDSVESIEEEVEEELNSEESGEDNITAESNDAFEEAIKDVEKELEKALNEPSQNNDLPEAETDSIYREKESELVEEAIKQNCHIFVTQEDIDKNVFPYAYVKAAREKHYANHPIKELSTRQEKFKQLCAKIKKNVAPAVSQFNMSKSAYQSARAKVSKSGSLNVTKLWSYKISDDIFRSVTNLADAKDHGLFILLDFSASMRTTLDDVIEQLMHLIIFAKTTNIPFELYAFTDTGVFSEVRENLQPGQIISNARVTQLCSSTLNKADFEEALFNLYLIHLASRVYKRLESAPFTFYNLPKIDQSSGTPLATSIIMLYPELKKFVSKVQKATFVNLIDGDTSHVDATFTENLWRANKIVNILGTKIDMKGNLRGREETRRAAINQIVKPLGYQTSCIFIAESTRGYAFRDVLIEITYKDMKASNDKMVSAEIRKEIRKNGCAIIDNALGYDCLYIMQSDNSDEIEKPLTTGETLAQIQKSFMSNNIEAKNKKILMQHFGKFVA